MVRVQLVIDDPASRLTLKTILEAEGHLVVEESPEVLIADNPTAAAKYAKAQPTLVLASASGIRDAVAGMRQGVYGYLFVPFQPGEAGIMVERAAQSRIPARSSMAAEFGEDSVDSTPMTLEEMEARYILAAIRRCRSNRSKAARVLGIGRNTLWRKLKRIQESKRF